MPFDGGHADRRAESGRGIGPDGEQKALEVLDALDTVGELARGCEEVGETAEAVRYAEQQIAAFWQADLPAARREFQLAVARYRPQERFTHLLHYGLDPKVVCLSRLANTHWFLGEPDAATAARAAALDWAEQIGHAFSRTTALTFGALLAVDMADEKGVRCHATRLAADVEADHPLHRAPVSAFQGYLAVLDGATGTGLAAIAATERDTTAEPATRPGSVWVRGGSLRVRVFAGVSGRCPLWTRNDGGSRSEPQVCDADRSRRSVLRVGHRPDSRRGRRLTPSAGSRRHRS